MSTRKVVDSVLERLEDGGISAEEAIRAALSGSAALTALVSRSARRGCRRPTIRPIKQTPEAVAIAAVRSVKKRLGRSTNVLSVHWGVARRRGRRTSEAGVVVHVRRKMKLASLRARRQRIVPSQVSLRHRGRRFRVRVDVQRIKALAELQIAFVQPADHGVIRRNGVPIGALGGIVAGPGGRFAITAGHVAGLVTPGTAADCVDDEAGTFPLGGVRRNRFSDGIDIAAIGPVPAVPPAAVLNNALVRNPTSADTHHRVRLILPGLPTPIESHIDDVNRLRGFKTPVGTITMKGLTAIARVTDPGDSGAPALDDGGALIGFVVGADSLHTFLLPARRALDAIQDAL
jgi:hypothetical protein